MKNKKGYVIQKIGYEYNDETYYRPEDGGGNPVVVITDEFIAKKRWLELEVEAWREQRIGYYGDGLDDIAENEREFENALEAIGVDYNSFWDIKIPKTATDDEIKRLIKASKVRMYEIIEVDIEESLSLDEDIQPQESILNTQDILSKQGRAGIFDSVNQFVSPDVNPMKIPDIVSIDDIKGVIKDTEDDFLSIKQEMNRLKDEARSKVKNFFIKGMNSIFDKYPEVKSVSWAQYTPYFNDGDETIFSAHIDDFYINGVNNYGDIMYGYDKSDFEGDEILDKNEMDYDWVDRKKVYKTPDSRSVKIYEAISGFLDQLDDDDYKTMFGDHAMVIVKKDEVVIEEYDHD